MSQRLARLALWSGLGVALLVTGYLLLNTTFMGYDDEGFVLISLRNYLAGLRLYDDVFSQYGPWPYVYHQIVTTLAGGAPLTHNFGRALTLFHWVTMALLCGGISWRLTRSQVAATAATVIAFGLTWQMTSEPSHPGSMISLLVALAGLLMTLLPDAKRPALVYAGLGVITALLVLTKINVGLLLAAGLGCFVLRHVAWPRSWRLLRWLGTLGLLALPWVLLGAQLHLGWALTFAVQFTLCAAGLLWIDAPRTDDPLIDARSWMAAVVAAVVAGVIVCGWVMARGTSLHALVQTVLINPVRMPGKFIVGMAWYPESLLLAAVGALLLLKAGWEIRREGRLPLPTARLIVALRLVIFACFVVNVHVWSSYSGVFHFIAYCLPLLAVFTVPLEGSASANVRLARWGAAVVALPQVLHAFPVAGSQLGWATFLCVPLLVAGLWDAGRILPDLLGGLGQRVARAGGFLLAAATCFLLGLLAQTGWERYTTSRSLDLPGATDIRLNSAAREPLRLLALNAGIHADLLVSRQGMYSYNLWSGVPTPTAQNATHWFWLLDDAQQQEIIARLAATPRTGFIISHSIDQFLADHQIPVAGPLQDFLTQHYKELFRYGGFSFMVPTASHAVTFGRYELLKSESPDPALPPALFRTNVLLDGQPVQIRLEQGDYPWNVGPDLLAPKLDAFAEPINRDGRIAGPTVRLPADKPLRGLYRISIFSPKLPDTLRLYDYLLTVRDPAGRLLSESVY
jgi:hypothetical protein